MSLSSRAAAALACMLLAACGNEPAPSSPLAQGQTYTDWFYAGRSAELWQRFTPELQAAFGAADSLQAYQARTVAELGREVGAPSETVTTAGAAQVYARVASFERAPEPMLLQWAIDSAGAISGFVLRPAPTQ